jgi:hypothetical protein
MFNYYTRGHSLRLAPKNIRGGAPQPLIDFTKQIETRGRYVTLASN